MESVSLQRPATGYSNLTFFLTVSGSRPDFQERFVLRVEPDSSQLFDDMDILREWRVLRALAESGRVPVPTPLWLEDDREVLGSRFFVMERMAGRVPPDAPSFHASGWVRELSGSQYRQWSENGLAVLARIHQLTWSPSFDFLRPQGGEPPGIEAHLEALRTSAEWACAGRSFPVIDEVLALLVEAMPSSEPEVGLLWGDANPRNLLFSEDLAVSAVLDWENAAIGPAELDLGWWLMMDTYWSTSRGIDPHPANPGRDGMIAIYERHLGRTVQNLCYFELMATLRFFLVIVRVVELRIADGLVDGEIQDVLVAHPLFQQLRSRIEDLVMERATP